MSPNGDAETNRWGVFRDGNERSEADSLEQKSKASGWRRLSHTLRAVQPTSI